MNPVVCIIQARMGSTRLSGKVMKLLAGKEVLWHVVDRVKRCTLIDSVVIATTTRARDDVIADFCTEHGILFFRGSESDVLDRYYRAAEAHSARTVVRVTSDCPLIDPSVIQRMLEAFDPNSCDYFSNILEPRTFPKGLDTEVFTFAALEKAAREAETSYQREHVTPYIKENPELYRLTPFYNDKDLSELRWTLDTPEDYAFISMVFERLYGDNPAFGSADIHRLSADPKNCSCH